MYPILLHFFAFSVQLNRNEEIYGRSSRPVIGRPSIVHLAFAIPDNDDVGGLCGLDNLDHLWDCFRWGWIEYQVIYFEHSEYKYSEHYQPTRVIGSATIGVVWIAHLVPL